MYLNLRRGIMRLCRVIILFIVLFFTNNQSFSSGNNNSNNINKLESQVWTCSMHPQIRRNKPGKCPICSMDLIPLIESSVHNNNKQRVTLSDRAIKLAEVQTSKVIRKKAFLELMLNGKIVYDETKSANIVAHFSGRIEKLFANYTGIYVKKETHLAEIFGSDIYVDQREIFIAHNSLIKAQREKDPKIKAEIMRTYDSVMNKMRVLGFTKEQVEKIIKRGKVKDTLILYAPISGTVVKKNVVEGQHFKKGDNLFIISDLDKLWLNLDAYEQDLPFLKYGQKVEFEVKAIPGKKFESMIVFIDPVLNKNTRTSNVRVVVDNKKHLLKPEMFVQAKVFVQIGVNGVIQAETLKNKWISPMHPQIIKDHPGNCDICGMELVPAESTKYFKGSKDIGLQPLTIPASAALITGKRAVVYVEIKPSTYEARNVLIGPKVGNDYIVKSGLHEGEKVVTNGSFKIDSELQIKSGNAGMMYQFNNSESTENIKPEQSSNNIKTAQTAILDFYFDLQIMLSEDNAKDTVKTAKLFEDYLNSLNENQINKFKEKFKINITDVAEIVNKISQIKNINDIRASFFVLTKILTPYLKHLEHIINIKIYLYECSMAFNNKGAYWFQDTESIANPYFGTSMKKCGTLKSD
jgi:membrane fusion protein, copper/silver efflux system